jgi:glycosyltransferase involved in cell wall biosynthesis
MASAAETGRPAVAIAHDYLTQRGGAERVVLALARAFPDAPIYTTLYDPAGTFPEFAKLDVRTSGLNRIGALRRRHRAALPVLSIASSRLKVDADVVIASSSGWSHGFPTTGKKIVYCYSPARWLYQGDQYVGDRKGGLKRLALNLLRAGLKRWDKRAADSADRYLAISTVVRERIADCYGIESDIVPAPIAPEVTHVAPEPVNDSWVAPDGPPFLLCVSRLLPYKNVHAIVEAMRLMPEMRLVVVGRGPERARLRALAPSNVLMMEGISDGQMRWLYQTATAVVAASFEDFGLTPLEAAAQGTPSVVLRAGGFLDTVVDGRTGVFFDAPDPAAIAAAIEVASRHPWDQDVIRARAAEFSEERFAERIREAIHHTLSTQPAISQPHEPIQHLGEGPHHA